MSCHDPALPAYIPLRCTFVSSCCFWQHSLRTVGGNQGVGSAVQCWAQPRRKKRSVDFCTIGRRGRGWANWSAAHYKSEEIIMRFCTRRIHGQKRTRPGIFFFGFQFLINLLLFLWSLFFAAHTPSFRLWLVSHTWSAPSSSSRLYHTFRFAFWSLLIFAAQPLDGRCFSSRWYGSTLKSLTY
jgi:hypothetical protein